MSPSRARYVTACQQLLALGVVVIALVPATRVVSLDVVGVGPGQGVAQPSISVSPDQPTERARGRHVRLRRAGSSAASRPACGSRSVAHDSGDGTPMRGQGHARGPDVAGWSRLISPSGG